MAGEPKVSTAVNNTALLKLAAEKLQTSGLTLGDAALLHIEARAADQLPPEYGTHKDPRPVLLFNYLHPRTGEPLRHAPTLPPASRVRHLGSVKGFDGSVAKDPCSYLGPHDLPPAAYYPANFPWSTVLHDTAIDLIITEGELKAAKACKEGFPTIGLGGVWSTKSQRFGCDFLPSLELVDWRSRVVTIIFDSDLKTNTSVALAVNDLAGLLAERGAIVKIAFIPSDGGKVGLDDLLIINDGQATLVELLATANFFGYTTSLWELNQRYAFVRDTTSILVLDTITNGVVKLLDKDKFTAALEANRYCYAVELNKKGEILRTRVKAAKFWLEWPARHEVSRLTYEPGEGLMIIKPGDDYGECNIWPGWGCSPVKGDVEPFLELFRYLTKHITGTEARWFLQWLAYPVQAPGTKMNSAVILHGKQGIGKGQLAKAMSLVYGRNYGKITQQQLKSNFNGWEVRKQFIFGDEATGTDHHDQRQYAAALKDIVTRNVTTVNEKYIAEYEIPAKANLMFASNEADAFKLDTDDRRFFVVEGPTTPETRQFYDDLADWLADDQSGPALFHYLLNVDTKGFQPFADPPRTVAKEHMIEATQTDLARWCSLLLEDQASAMMKGAEGTDLITGKEALAHYTAYSSFNNRIPSIQGLMNALRDVGAVRACNHAPITSPSGARERYFAIRNQPYWATASTTKAAAYLKNKDKNTQFRAL